MKLYGILLTLCVAISANNNVPTTTQNIVKTIKKYKKPLLTAAGLLLVVSGVHIAYMRHLAKIKEIPSATFNKIMMDHKEPQKQLFHLVAEILPQSASPYMVCVPDEIDEKNILSELQLHISSKFFSKDIAAFEKGPFYALFEAWAQKKWSQVKESDGIEEICISMFDNDSLDWEKGKYVFTFTSRKHAKNK